MTWIAIAAGVSVGWLFIIVQSLVHSARSERHSPRFTTARLREIALRCLSWSMRLRMQRKLVHAGLFRWEVTDLVLLQAGGSFLAGLGVALAGFSFWMIPVAMILVCVLIESWITQRQRAYGARIAEHLPGFLDMLCLCLGAGMSFNASLMVVLRYLSDGPLRMLWRDWLFDVRAGSTRVDAYTRLMHKSTQASLQRLCIAMIQAERTGAALAASLQSQSRQMRQDQVLSAERRAAQAPMRMLMPLILCFFPSTFLVLAFSIWVGVSDAF